MALLEIKCPNCGEHDSRMQTGKIRRLWRDSARVASYGFSPDFHCDPCGFEWMMKAVTEADKLLDLHEAMKEFRHTTGKTEVNL